MDVHGEWEKCTPESMTPFSAVAYFFGRHLHLELGVPIGLIHSSWGGTPVESWMRNEITEEREEFKLAAQAQSDNQRPWCPSDPGVTYNAMIAPLTNYNIAGAIWYQGESNVARPDIYDDQFEAMIADWRAQWKKDFPFYFVQIAPFEFYGPENNSAFLREAQTHTLRLENTGMVVISDIGNIKDIHPKNKQDVGKRLANWALARHYQTIESEVSGPIYREMKIEGDKIRIFFDHVSEGLTQNGSELTDFEIADADMNFVGAKAVIEGNTVLVYSKQVKHPKEVRFAWNNVATPNLFNSEGLPASCFRTYQ
jgi:sialate O-acetylesterase